MNRRILDRKVWNLAGWAALIAIAAAPAIAQYRPDSRWPSERLNPQAERNVAGEFDYYALVLSWSPTYCSEAGSDDDMQCNRADGRRFSFVLHGLWPQYERGYPNDCRISRRPFVPQNVINGMLDVMPSPRLVIHEYRKHGTCSGLDVNEYFGTARRLFQSIKVPEQYKNPYDTQFESPTVIAKEFSRANPGLTPDMMGVVCGGSGNRLKEIRFCFSKDGKPRTCGDNENPRQLCRADRVYIPPVRSTARDAAPNSQFDNRGGFDNGRKPSPLPGPRLPEDDNSL